MAVTGRKRGRLSLALRSEATVEDQLLGEDGVILAVGQHGAERVSLERLAEVAQVTGGARP